MGKWNIIPEATCRYCGKKFVPAIEHALKDTYGVYCKPTCYLKGENLSKRKCRRVFAFKGDYVETYSSAVNAARKLGLEPKMIRKSCRDGSTYNGYTWKYEE